MERHQTKSTASKNGVSNHSKVVAGRSLRQKVKTEAYDVIMRIRRELDEAQIYYTLSDYLADAISISAVVPGERWEIDVFADGDVYFERFRSSGKIDDEKALADSIREYAE